MSENLKNGLLVLVAVVTIANTVMILNDDGVSYDKTSVNKSAVSNAAATPVDQQNQMNLKKQNKEVNIPPKQQGPKTAIQFAEMEHNFGAIEQNTTNPKTFIFTNTGDKPLIISDAKGSCGCTVPSFPKEPIPPGETGEIEVIYRPGQQKNQQTKTVTITANTEPAQTVLRIKANVKPGENDPNSGSAPVQIGG
jgi:hypothetical protein